MKIPAASITCLLTIAAAILALVACQPNVSIEAAQYAVNGHKLYVTHCQNCHGNKGEGLGLLYPPLTDTSYLQAHRQELPCIIKYGLDGKIIVNNQEYNSLMPAIPELTPVDIAYILTYVTTTFGTSNTLYSQQEVHQALESCP